MLELLVNGVSAVGIVASVVALFSIIRGWVLSILWGWFIVPYFDLPALSIPLAIGISLTVGFLTRQNVPDIKAKYLDKKYAWAKLLTPAYVLLIGWVVQKFL